MISTVASSSIESPPQLESWKVTIKSWKVTIKSRQTYLNLTYAIFKQCCEKSTRERRPPPQFGRANVNREPAHFVGV